MTITVPIAGLEQLSAPVLLSTAGPTQASALASRSAVASARAAANGDTISLSERALQQLSADERRLGQAAAVPGSHATGEQQQQFQTTLASYKIAQTRVDATAFDPRYQAYVDRINDPKATDDQKLQAYIGFKADRAVEHGHEHSFGQDTIDFKFDWLTRNSDFLIRARSSDRALTDLNQAETAESNRTREPIDLNQHTAKTIDVIAQYSPLQKAVASVDLIYDKVSSALANWDLNNYLSASPGQQTHPEAFAVDPKTAIAGAVASALEALQQSRAGSSSDTGSVAFREHFAELVTSFGRLATNREKAIFISF